jgi:hypothetical protein
MHNEINQIAIRNVGSQILFEIIQVSLYSIWYFFLIFHIKISHIKLFKVHERPAK